MNPIPYAVVLAVIAVAIVILLLYRRTLTENEDDVVHIVDADDKVIAEQAARAQKLAVVDRWLKILIIVLVLGGITLLVVYVYLTFIASEAVRMG